MEKRAPVMYVSSRGGYEAHHIRRSVRRLPRSLQSRLALRIIAGRWSVAAPNSSEFGDGIARSEFNPEIFGDELCEAMRDVKRLFDPDQRINPASVVDAPRMTENLRDANLPPVPLLRTRLDFEVLGGITGAADRCMNIGLCRKSTTGRCAGLTSSPAKRNTRLQGARTHW
jgi:hypothetical protein